MSASFPLTAALSDTTGDDAGGTGTDPAHVHPVHQPDNRCAGHTGQHRLSPTLEPLLDNMTPTPARLTPTDLIYLPRDDHRFEIRDPRNLQQSSYFPENVVH